MTWLKEAYKPSFPKPGTYYTVVDAVDFFQWKYANSIPQGVTFTKNPPQLDALTGHQIIASAEIPPQSLVVSQLGYKTAGDVPTEVNFHFGTVRSPADILAKYNRIKDELSRKAKSLRQSVFIHKYLISSEEKPSLYKVISGNDHEVTLDDFGPFEQILDRLIKRQASLNKESKAKKGRAYELSETTRYNKIMSVMASKTPVDSSKLEFVLKYIDLPSMGTRKLSWLELLAKTDPNAGMQLGGLKKFEEVPWVKEVNKYNSV